MMYRKEQFKKLLFCVTAAALLAGCSNTDPEVIGNVGVNDTKAQVEESEEGVTPVPDTQEESENQSQDTQDAQENQDVVFEDVPEINEESQEPDYVIETEQTSAKTSVFKELETLPTDAEISSMSSESNGWGQGTQVDDLNRPAGCLQYQEKFGSHAVRFIMNDTEEKVIYLTFDEGYENGYTGQILDTLKEKNVKAIFFITMDYAKKEPELVQRMIDEGHVVGNHSVTHPSAGLPSLSLEQQENEVMELHNYVKENFGYEMYLFRFPAGIFSEQSLGILDKCGYTGVFWSFAFHDWDPDNQMAYGDALQKTVDCLHPGAIYLLHAVSSTNTAILGEFIDTAIAQGYTFQ